MGFEGYGAAAREGVTAGEFWWETKYRALDEAVCGARISVITDVAAKAAITLATKQREDAAKLLGCASEIERLREERDEALDELDYVRENVAKLVQEKHANLVLRAQLAAADAMAKLAVWMRGDHG